MQFGWQRVNIQGLKKKKKGDQHLYSDPNAREKYCLLQTFPRTAAAPMRAALHNYLHVNRGISSSTSSRKIWLLGAVFRLEITPSCAVTCSQ